MSLNNPYHKIWRPMLDFNAMFQSMLMSGQKPSIAYLKSEKYACQQEKISLLTSAQLIIRDLYEIFNYIEPCNNNKNTYSHRIYELYLRVCTEVENNFKSILISNSCSSYNNIIDYFKLEKATKLSEYEVSFLRWKEQIFIRPFKAWGKGSYKTISWYEHYNEVKHNRYANFPKANLGNLINSVAGLLCILHAQYGEDIYVASFEGISFFQNNQYNVENETYILKAPKFLGDEYNFIWANIENQPNPVLNFPF